MAKRRKRAVFVPGVADTLGALHAKGLPLALVTNKPTPFVAPLLARWISRNILPWLSAAMM
jgi:phosphoglycolate phosphatase-like HAD superfamily hydrolase